MQGSLVPPAARVRMDRWTGLSSSEDGQMDGRLVEAAPPVY